MELQCPQCGKAMQISAEEVALHGGAVVCPQCLAVFDAAGSVPPGTVAERVPVRVIEEHLTYGFCPHCGRKIPQGVNFCPYCGQSLREIPAAVTGDNSIAKAEAPAGVVDKPSAKPTAAVSTAAQPDKTRVATARAWAPVLPTYRYAKAGVSWRSGKERAGVGFTVCALVVIAAQLALLAFFIYKVSLIS